MDNLMRDPEIAPQLLKLLNDKLQDTRRELETVKKANDDLRLQNANLTTTRSDGGNATEASSRIGALEAMLENTKTELDTLRAENAELRAQVGNTSKTEDISDSVEALRRTDCSGHCAASQTVTQLQSDMQLLRQKLDTRNAEFIDLQNCAGGLREQLASREAALQTMQGRLDELRQQLDTHRLAAEQKDAKLRQELEVMWQKYMKYKALLQEAQAQAQAVHPLTGPTSTKDGLVVSQHSTPTPALQTAPEVVDNKNNGTPSKKMSWDEVVMHVLTQPCFPPNSPGAPQKIPKYIRETTGAGLILCCDEGLQYPFASHQARLLAPQAICKNSSTADLEFGPPTNALVKMVGSRREVFFNATSGVCYAGTFLCERTGELTPEEYKELPRNVKDAIVKRALPPTATRSLFQAPQRRRDKLRSLYNSGEAKVQYLILQYEGHNKAFLSSIMNYNATHIPETDPTLAASKRPAPAGYQGGGPSKRSKAWKRE